MKDFTSSNKWTNLRRKVQSRNDAIEKELVDYIALLEKQIMTLEMMVNKLIVEDDRK